MAKKKGVMPGFIYPPNGGITNNFMKAMDATYRAGAFNHPWASNLGVRPNRARTLNIHDFLESDAEWMFWVDTDMLWEPRAIITLRQFAEKKKIKIVSGWTVVIKNGILPHAYRKRGKHYVPYGEIEPYSDPLVVDAVGSACLLVHRDLLTEVAEHTHKFTEYLWNEEEFNEELGYHIGQDIAFSDRVNRFTDHEIWYHPGAPFIHMKLTPYGPKEYMRFMAGLRERVTNGDIHTTNVQPADQE